jgi:hypothetical protein
MHLFSYARATNAELTPQLVTARQPTQGNSQETETLLSHALNAEKCLKVVQNQFLLSEEKISNINQKTTAADQKWEARVKEYETRLKAGEKKHKRESQGAKDGMLKLKNLSIVIFFLVSSLPASRPRFCTDDLA